LPELVGLELYELAEHARHFETIASMFLNSIVWRKKDTLSAKLKSYINEVIIQELNYYDVFLSIILEVTSQPGNYFNSDFLHKYLMSMTLADRDASWTQCIYSLYPGDKNYVSIIKRILDWAWSEENRTNISDESLRLMCQTMIWFLTSNDRTLRDSTTKALVCLLEERIPILIQLLVIFETVNDPYILQRLYAVAYGCAVRTNQLHLLKDLGERVFQQIFNKPEVVPDILLRDHARGVIEFAVHNGVTFEFDLMKIRPPYNCSWDDNIPTKEELRSTYAGKEYSTLEFSVLGFGDFARYIIGTNSNQFDWYENRLGDTIHFREEVLDRFLSRLDPTQQQLWGDLIPYILGDSTVDEFFENDSYVIINPENSQIEFKKIITRKSTRTIKLSNKSFEKSLTKELLAVYLQEIKPYLDLDRNLIEDNKIFDLEFAQRYIFTKIMALGWSPEKHGYFDNNIGHSYSHGRRSKIVERIGKKYQWIAYHEFLARVADNFVFKKGHYDGTWNPYVRDIDPTTVIKSEALVKSDRTDFCTVDYDNWNIQDSEWMKFAGDLPNPLQIINITDRDNVEWLVLEILPVWKEPIEIGADSWEVPHKEIWYHIHSYITKNQSYDNIVNSLLGQDLMRFDFPLPSSRYEFFSREYHWSPSLQLFNLQEHTNRAFEPVTDEEGRIIGEVCNTTLDYLWEEPKDASKQESLKLCKPTKLLHDLLGLEYSKIEGILRNSENEEICFDPSTTNPTHSCLIVRKNDFLRKLKENDLNVFWTIRGEKLILGSLHKSNEDDTRLCISGIVYVNSNSGTLLHRPHFKLE